MWGVSIPLGQRLLFGRARSWFARVRSWFAQARSWWARAIATDAGKVALAAALRQGLISAAAQRVQQANRTEKISASSRYLTAKTTHRSPRLLSPSRKSFQLVELSRLGFWLWQRAATELPRVQGRKGQFNRPCGDDGCSKRWSTAQHTKSIGQEL